ncbi:MAG: phosphomethylpyrimidine synthase ThiC, partial [Acidimicrobiales bacterium]
MYVEGTTPGIRVPFTEVVLGPTPDAGGGSTPNPPVRLYDTSGPGCAPGEGLPPLRRPWVVGRGDVADVAARPA